MDHQDRHTYEDFPLLGSGVVLLVVGFSAILADIHSGDNVPFLNVMAYGTFGLGVLSFVAHFLKKFDGTKMVADRNITNITDQSTEDKSQKHTVSGWSTACGILLIIGLTSVLALAIFHSVPWVKGVATPLIFVGLWGSVLCAGRGLERKTNGGA